MSDLVHRLRKGTVLFGKYNMDPLSREAADEIERLSAENNKLRQTIQRIQVGHNGGLASAASKKRRINQEQ